MKRINCLLRGGRKTKKAVSKLHEIWKDIPGYEGLYQISNYGNVKSLDRIYYQKSRYNTMIHKKYKGKNIKPTDNGNGYLIVGLRDNNRKRKNYYVHRLVAEVFIQNPFDYTEVNHKDFDKSNNYATNLEWITRKENVNYSLSNMEKPRIKTKRTASGEKYITRKNNKWRLMIQRKSLRIEKYFNSLEDAVKTREVILNGR